MIPVILSGGSGTRLWPLSRGQYPKQFLPLVSDYSMVQETVLRLKGIRGLKSPMAVCNEDHRFMMAQQLQEIGSAASAIILEPMGRNTAPAVALAALAVASPDEVILILPADHVIANVEKFHIAVNIARQLAEQDYLVTFGVVPNAPETGYGYIKSGEALDNGAYKVATFVEKPDIATATRYVESGEYYWNSGMFAFKASRYLQELEKFNAPMLQACRAALAEAKRDADFVRISKEIFAACPSDSIDYAVMEKTDSAVIIPLDADWNDVGSWSALWDVTNKDTNGNAIHGDVVAIDSHDCFLHSGHKLVTAIGLQEIVVVETSDAVMVAAKDRVQDVKTVVEKLKHDKRSESEAHRKVYRPWGMYDSLVSGDRYQTKHIVVNPGAQMSLQKHHHRAEHWIVVKGTALITRGTEEILLTENESTFIPLGVTHRITNPGVIPLEIIEVQSGSYLGEDDIVRFDDNYGRS